MNPKPHINVVAIGRQKPLIALAALSSLFNREEPQEETSFSRLSEDAQELIVSASIGQFSDNKPEIKESVRQEIINWVNNG